MYADEQDPDIRRWAVVDGVERDELIWSRQSDDPAPELNTRS